MGQISATNLTMKLKYAGLETLFEESPPDDVQKQGSVLFATSFQNEHDMTKLSTNEVPYNGEAREKILAFMYGQTLAVFATHPPFILLEAAITLQL